MNTGYRQGAGLLISQINRYQDKAEQAEQRKQDNLRRSQLDDERRMDKAYSRNQQSKRERINQERYDTSQERQQTIDDRATFLFDEAQAKKAQQNQARQSYANTLISGTESDHVQATTKNAEMLNSVMGQGYSGTGNGIVLQDDGSDSFKVDISQADGSTKPATQTPSDNSSPQIRVKKENAERLEQHLVNGAKSFDDSGGDPSQKQAYLRASLTTDPETGDTVEATPEQYAENLKQQGFNIEQTTEGLSPSVAESVVSLEDERDRKARDLRYLGAEHIRKGSISEEGRSEVMRADQSLRETEAKLADSPKDKRGNGYLSDVAATIDNLPSAFKFAEKGIRTREGGFVDFAEGVVFQTGKNFAAIPSAAKSFLGKALNQAVDFTREYVSEPVFGTDIKTAAKYEVSAETGVKAKASKADLGAEGAVEELASVKAEMEKNGVKTPATQEQVELAQQEFHDQQMILNKKYKAKKQRDKAEIDLYLAGLRTDEQMMNYAETGDIRYSKQDFAGHTDKQVKRQLSQISLIEKQIALAKKFAESDPNSTKSVAAKQTVLKTFKSSAKGIMGEIADIRFTGKHDTANRNALVARLSAATDIAMTSQNWELRDYASPSKHVMLRQAMSKFANYKGDPKPTSLTPFMATVQHESRRAPVAQGIMEVHKGVDPKHNITEQDILGEFNDQMDIVISRMGVDYVTEEKVDDILRSVRTHFAQFKRAE